jgi:hypothetical protein
MTMAYRVSFGPIGSKILKRERIYDDEGPFDGMIDLEELKKINLNII